MTRIEISRTNKLGYAAVVAMEAYARSNVDRRLLELLKVRASVINGCTFCVDMHITDGLKHGIPQRVLTAATAWEHAGALLTERECAVLALTDAVTRLGEDAVPDAVWQRAAVHFDDAQLGALVLAIATINVWNRIAIATRMHPPVDAGHPIAQSRSMVRTTPAAENWNAERGRLLGIAYRMLGDFGEAEDVVSEVAVAAIAAEQDGAPVRSWPAWMTTTCVRRSIDRVRALAARREVYPGTWLPEPVAMERLPDEVAATRELLSIALLHLAEQLDAHARAAVVLHRAFAMTAVEIGEILERTPAAVRQLISRAERALQIDAESRPARPADPTAMDALLQAIANGDVAGVMAMLDDDVTLFSDGGGVVSAALRPVRGPDAVARFLIGIFEKSTRAGDAVAFAPVWVNGAIGLDTQRGARRDIATVVLAADGRIGALYLISNPAKLTRV